MGCDIAIFHSGKHTHAPTHRRTGRGGVRVGSWPPNSGRYDIYSGKRQHMFHIYFYSGKRQHICFTNRVTPNGTSIHLPEKHFGWGNKGDVYRVLLYDRQQIGTAIVHYFSNNLCSPFRQNSVWPPHQMDVGPYAYARVLLNKLEKHATSEYKSIGRHRW